MEFNFRKQWQTILRVPIQKNITNNQQQPGLFATSCRGSATSPFNLKKTKERSLFSKVYQLGARAYLTFGTYEPRIFHTANMYANAQYDTYYLKKKKLVLTKDLVSRFYHERLPKARERRYDANLLGNLSHPNFLYHSIKQFAAEYERIRSTLSK